MANTIDFILTTAADELISKVLSGKTLNFTRMAVGDGFSYDINVAKGFKNVVNEVLSLDITKKETLSPKSVKITSAFKNTDAQKEFYYREVGLYAQDPDTGEEVLYAYGNRNDAAELITQTGANVVTKQLVFVISVGDSAKVTFNVNADVYALQEDMLDVQADISEIQTNLGTAQTDITTLQTGLNQTNSNITTLQTSLDQANANVTTLQTDLGNANTNISTLQTDLGNANTNIANMQSDKADKTLANTGMITNCLLEIPQRIKLELSADKNTIIVKAGTEVYDGKGSYFTVKEDLSISTVYSEAAPCFVLLNKSNRGIFLSYYSDPRFVFNDGEILYTGTDGETYNCYLPLGLITRNTEGLSTIDHIFNGMGYFGSTIWVDKGVKGLIPNGRNTDGTLNNIEWEQTSIHFRTFDKNETYIVDLGLDGNILSRVIPSSNYRYDSVLNYNYTVLGIWRDTYIGTCKLTAGVISDFNVLKPFRLLNYNDYSKKIEELETRLATLEAN